MPHVSTWRAARWPIRSHRPVLTLALMMSMASSDSAVAQTGAQTARTAPPLAEIIVTARRKAEALGRAGLPISVIAGKDVLEGGITTLDRLADRFPALTIQPNSTGNLIFIRGVGNFSLLPNSEPAIAWSYDGVFVSRPIGTNGQLFDLERVELLKGPQGVLYGRNASGGSVNIVPQHPIAGTNTAYASANVASYAMRSAEAAINLSLGKNAALRISGTLADQANFLKGYTKGQSQQSLRAQLATDLTPDVSLRLASDYTHLGGIGLGTSYLGNHVFDLASRTYRFNPANLQPSAGIYSDEGQAFRQTIFINSLGRRLDPIRSVPRQDSSFYGFHAQLTAKFGFGTLTVLPAWRHSNIDAIVSGAPFGYRQIEKDGQSSVEMRLAGRTDKVEWLVGAFLFNDDIDSINPNNFSSSLFFGKSNYATQSRALFGNATVHLGARLRISGGARVTRDAKRFSSDTSTFAIICQRRVNNIPSCPDVPPFQLSDSIADIPFAVPAVGRPPVPILVNGLNSGAIVLRSDRADAGHLVEKATTWRASTEADIGADGLAYASVETGNRPGGFNAATGFETFAPERITAFTLGARQRACRGRLTLGVELFWWNYMDQQANSLQPDLAIPPRFGLLTRNIGGSRMRGVELEVGLRPTADTLLNADIQYLDARYRRFSYIQANNGMPPLTGCQFSLERTTNLYRVDCTGQRPYNTPRWSIGLSARHTFALGPAYLTASARTSYRSRQTLGFTFLPEQRIGGYSTSDAQLTLTDRTKQFELAAYVHNIEGQRVPLFVIFHPTTNAVVASTISPRVFGIRVLRHF